MAEAEHVRILRLGVEEWNNWRKASPGIVPDLSYADLQGANLWGANLEKAVLTGAHLQKADLRGANLEKAVLMEAILEEANLEEANLTKAELLEAQLDGANLTKANMKGASLAEANLDGANLRRADLRGAWMKASMMDTNMEGANLRGADLEGAYLLMTDLTGAKLHRTQFSSRAALNILAHPLTDEQLAVAVFADEQEFYAKDRHEAAPEAPTLRIRFDDDKPWDAARFGIFFATLHTAYARLFYLATTEEEDEAAIHRVLDRKAYHLPPEQDIYLKYVSTGTLTADFVSYLSDPGNRAALEAVGMCLGGFAATLLAIPTFGEKIASIQEKRANTKVKRLEAEKLQRDLDRTAQLETRPAIPQDFGCPPAGDAEESRSLAEKALQDLELKQIMLVLGPKSPTVRKNPELIAVAAREFYLSLADLAKLGRAPRIDKEDKPDDHQSPGM